MTDAPKSRMNRCTICGREYLPLSFEDFMRRKRENPDLDITSIFCDDCLKAHAAAMDTIRGTQAHRVIRRIFSIGDGG